MSCELHTCMYVVFVTDGDFVRMKQRVGDALLEIIKQSTYVYTCMYKCTLVVHTITYVVSCDNGLLIRLHSV